MTDDVLLSGAQLVFRYDHGRITPTLLDLEHRRAVAFAPFPTRRASFEAAVRDLTKRFPGCMLMHDPSEVTP